MICRQIILNKLSSLLFCCLLFPTAIVCAEEKSSQAAAPKKDNRPNILMIAVDDLNHWVHFMNRNPQSISPNIDRLAAKGMSFRSAYAPSAICNSSRTAILTGMRPGTTGVYSNDIDWRSVVGDGYALPGFLRKQGYYVAGGGKIFHNGGVIRQSDWDYYFKGEKKYPLEGSEAKASYSGKTLRYKAGMLDIGEIDGGDDVVGDYHVARWGAEEVSKVHDQPFFVALGIFRPHLPWNVPKKYFDMFPEASLQLPPYKEDDLIDLPTYSQDSAEHTKILQEDSWKKAIRGYLASIAYADVQIGRVLDALDKGPNRDNTIIVLWGDHGWSLGEKHRWRKSALWEEPTRTPYVWVVPGVTKSNTKTTTPVDLQSLWPTFAELIGAKLPQHVEGVSIVPLLRNPDAKWDVPAITTYHNNNHAIRLGNMRYIRYSKGEEELYDHSKDPYEWTNLAYKNEDENIKKTRVNFSKWLPKTNRESDEAKKIYHGETDIVPVIGDGDGEAGRDSGLKIDKEGKTKEQIQAERKAKRMAEKQEE